MMLWLLYYDKNFNDIAESTSFKKRDVCSGKQKVVLL